MHFWVRCIPSAAFVLVYAPIFEIYSELLKATHRVFLGVWSVAGDSPPHWENFQHFRVEMERAINFQRDADFCADKSSIFVKMCSTDLKILKISLKIDSYLVLEIFMTFFLEFNVTFQAKIGGLGL